MTERREDDLYVGAVEGEDQLDPSESLTGDNTEDPLAAGYSPPDREPTATRFGTTADEQYQGESLDQLLAEEEPDISADDVPVDDVTASGMRTDPDVRAGRLLAPDEGQLPDQETDAIAEDVGRAGDASSAEEAAMHIIDEDAEL